MSETEPSTSAVTLPPRGFCASGNCGRAIKAVLLAAVIFVCGGAAGFGVAILRHGPRPMGGGFGPEPPVDVMVDRLSQELLLSDDQVKQVRAIYEERRDALHAIVSTVQPELKAEYDKLDQQMKAVLNPQQYQRWSERFQNVRNQMLPPHGPGMGPGGPGMGPGGPGFGPGGPGMGPGGPGPMGRGAGGPPGGPPDGMPPPGGP